MVADKMKIQDQIANIREFVHYLKSVQGISLEVLNSDKEKQFAVLHALQLSIEGIINIATHVVSADELGVPENYSHVFDLLAKGKVIDQDFAETLKQMVRFRNRIVHVYWKIDLEEVMKILKKHLSDFDAFISIINESIK